MSGSGKTSREPTLTEKKDEREVDGNPMWKWTKISTFFTLFIPLRKQETFHFLANHFTFSPNQNKKKTPQFLSFKILWQVVNEGNVEPRSFIIKLKAFNEQVSDECFSPFPPFIGLRHIKGKLCLFSSVSPVLFFFFLFREKRKREEKFFIYRENSFSNSFTRKKSQSKFFFLF